MIISDWVSTIVARKFEGTRRAKLLEGLELDVIIDLAEGDWRDLLMAAHLENGDWPAVIEQKFGTRPDSSPTT